MESPLPFIQQNLEEGIFIREFSSEIALEELQWHWDERDRLVTPLVESDWLLQMDNALPQPLEKGKTYKIPAGFYHRIHRGSGILRVKIQETGAGVL
jgi:hypothetical protein